jgi:CRP-like cAMP-binding protein
MAGVITRPRSGTGTITGNRLLDSLLRERPALRAHVDIGAIASGTELADEGRRATHVWFPMDGFASVVVRLASGAVTEAIAVGREGMAGLGVWLGVEHSLETVVQQRAGNVARVSGAAFCRTVAASRPSRELVNHYAAYTLRQQAQSAVCSACHSVEERLCRWLLGAADRSGGNVLEISQAAVADVLGVRRQTVGDVAVRLQRDRVIAYRRGDIRIVNRPALEQRACECYRTLRDLYRRTVEPRLK